MYQKENTYSCRSSTYLLHLRSITECLYNAWDRSFNTLWDYFNWLVNSRMKQVRFWKPPTKKNRCIMNHSQLLTTNTHDSLSGAFKKKNASQVESCSSSLSSALVKSRKIFPLSAPPGVTVVLLLVPETWCRVVNLGNESPLGTEVTLRVVLTSEAATLVVLEATFVWLKWAVGVGSHGVGVALLPSYLGVVELV